MGLDIGDLSLFADEDPLREEVARYRKLSEVENMALWASRLDPNEFKDNFEVYTRHSVVALCPTEEWAALICWTLNAQYAEWVNVQNSKRKNG